MYSPVFYCFVAYCYSSLLRFYLYILLRTVSLFECYVDFDCLHLWYITALTDELISIGNFNKLIKLGYNLHSFLGTGDSLQANHKLTISDNLIALLKSGHWK